MVPGRIDRRHLREHRDVTHGLILLGTDLNLMAVPGVVNYSRVKFDRPHDYQLLCHEYCGQVTIAWPPICAWWIWLHSSARRFADLRSTRRDPAYRLLESKECLTCHSIDGGRTSRPLSRASTDASRS